MKKLLFLFLLLVSCSSNEAQVFSESHEPVDGPELGLLVDEIKIEGAEATYTFENPDGELSKGSFAYEIQSGGVYPSTIDPRYNSLQKDEDLAAFMKKMYSPSDNFLNPEPLRIGENQWYIFPAPEFSTNVTEFAVYRGENEVLVVMLQSFGADEEIVSKDKEVLQKFLESLVVAAK